MSCPDPRHKQVFEELLRHFSPARGAWELGYLDNYSLIAGLDVGGFGAVFRAVNEKPASSPLERLVAIKCLLPERMADPKALCRFAEEVRLHKKLRSYWVVPILDNATYQSLPYFVMPFITGHTLKEKRQTWGRLPELEAVRIGMDVCQGLHDAHTDGLIHRDLKPGNVILDALDYGRAKILDFGLGILVDGERLVTSDSLGGPLGTFNYIAPELWRDKTACSPQSDLFSLGCILYEMLTGQLAFPEFSRLLKYQPPPNLLNAIPHVDPTLATVVMRLLAKRPNDRFSSAKELREQLKCLLRGLHYRRTPCEPNWPNVASNEFRDAVAMLASAATGVPKEWCQGDVGLAMGLGDYVQMTRELHDAAINVINKLLMFESEHVVPLVLNGDESSKSIDDIERGFVRTAEACRATTGEPSEIAEIVQRVRKQLDGLRFAETLDVNTLRQVVAELASFSRELANLHLKAIDLTLHLAVGGSLLNRQLSGSPNAAQSTPTADMPLPQ